MYSALQLTKKFCSYYLKAGNGKGHGIHSPFVFDFIIHVLNDKKKYSGFEKIESLRQRLLNDSSVIEVEDFGAGSALVHKKNRKISEIARSSLKNKKYAQLLFRIAKYYHCQKIVELGTSLGITTSYLSSANKEAQVWTLEGSHEIAQIATNNFKSLDLNNIQLIEGAFEKTMPALTDLKNIDLLFVDGNHRREPTLAYFNFFLKQSSTKSIFIFDDIHWSAEMEEAWKILQEHPSVTMTIDLFFIGIVLFSTDFKVKQHFTIRF